MYLFRLTYVYQENVNHKIQYSGWDGRRGGGDGIERAHRWMQVMVVISFLAWVMGSSVIRSVKSINNLYK